MTAQNRSDYRTAIPEVETNGGLRGGLPALRPLSVRPAPSPAHHVDIGARLEERIGRGFDAIDPWGRIKDDVSLLRGVVRSDFRQTDFVEGELTARLGPADRGIVTVSPSSANCTTTRNLTGSFATRFLISSKRKFGLHAVALASRDIRCPRPAAPGSARSGSCRPHCELECGARRLSPPACRRGACRRSGVRELPVPESERRTCDSRRWLPWGRWQAVD